MSTPLSARQSVRLAAIESRLAIGGGVDRRYHAAEIAFFDGLYWVTNRPRWAKPVLFSVVCWMAERRLAKLDKVPPAGPGDGPRVF